MSQQIPLKWTSAIFDTSGYASATRGYISALIDSGEVNLTLQPVSFEKQKTSHGNIQDICKSLIGKQGVPYKINLVHLTPDNFPSVLEVGKYNIGYTVWETDKLPKGWADACNRMDEIWVPSTWNKTVFKENGVFKPIYVVPHKVERDESKKNQKLSMGVNENTFVFYSIFQWIERKNPLSLLKAYLSEFKENENVCLSLKTYRLNTSLQEKEIIKKDIANVKSGLNLKGYPQVRFFGDLLSAEQMRAFHHRGDCFVLPHRGEGFGIPHAEAMTYGNPVIATGYSGNLDFMNSNNSFLIDYQLTPVCNMIFPNYNGHMTWAEPSIDNLKKHMRYVFENREEAARIGLKGKEEVKIKLNSKKIGKIITSRLRKIQKELE